MEAMLAEDFRGRILPFDSPAAAAFADIAAERRRNGRPSHRPMPRSRRSPGRVAPRWQRATLPILPDPGSSSSTRG